MNGDLKAGPPSTPIQHWARTVLGALDDAQAELDERAFRVLLDLVFVRATHLMIEFGLDAFRAGESNPAAEQAGETLIPQGRHRGKTIAQVAAAPRGASWIKWVLLTPNFPVHAEVETYARILLPEIYQAVIAEAERNGQL